MTLLVSDLKQSLRMMRKSPGFALTTFVVLALGIGANTAIFSVVNAALLRPLPYQNPSELVQLWHVPPAKSFPGMKRFALSAANYLDWSRQNHVFAESAIYRYARFDFVASQNAESVAAGAVQSTFFRVLGIHPMLGRSFRPEEDEAGHSHVVLLSYEFWQSHFGSDPKIVGRHMQLNGEDFAVIGVMGLGFHRPDWAKIWTPIAWTPKERSVRGEHHYLAIARLRNGVTFRQAQTELNLISERLARQFPEDDKGWGAAVVPLREELVGEARPALLVLLGAVGFVLLIACANVSNMVLAKTVARSKEMAIRAALGASRTRIVRHVLVETMLLALLGGAGGLMLATQGIKFLSKVVADRLPQATAIHLDLPVLAFTLAISMITGVLAGLLPALRFSQGDLDATLKQGLGKTDSYRGTQRSLSGLVVCEVALSFTLLIGAGLMIRSLHNLRRVDPGIDANHVLTMTASISPQKFAGPQSQNTFFERLLESVNAVPGVQASAAIDSLPVSGGGSTQPIEIEGRPHAAMSEQPEVAVRVASPDYPKVMRIPLLRGRYLRPADRGDSQSVALISQSMANQFWPGQNPIGRHVTLTFFPNASREIVGIVGDVKQSSLDSMVREATLYLPVAQLSASSLAPWRSFPLSLVVRTSGAIERGQAAVIRAVHRIDPTVPVLDVRSMDNLVAQSLSVRRYDMLLLSCFAILALVLAALGIYSVLSYSVKRRTHEIGIRMALGARSGQVLRLLLLEGMKASILGVLLGMMAASALGHLLSSLLFGVAVTDTATYVAVVGLLSGVALLANVIPAYRATRVDPIRQLRDQ